MRLLLQRVSRAAVAIGDRRVGSVGVGLLALVGFGRADGPELPETRAWRALRDKTLDLRVFPDAAGRLGRSLRDCGGGLLLVPQFTLYADLRHGRRPDFTAAAPPDIARPLYERLAEEFAAAAPGAFARGVFGAEMFLDFVNWGPVTLLLDSADFDRPR